MTELGVEGSPYLTVEEGEKIREQLDRIETMLQRLLTEAAGRRSQRRPKVAPPERQRDPALTTRAVRAMAKAAGEK